MKVWVVGHEYMVACLSVHDRICEPTEKRTYISIHGQCVCQSVGQMGTSRDGLDTPNRTAPHRTAPLPHLHRLLCVCVYPLGVYGWMCISTAARTHTQTRTLRQSGRGEARQQGTHRIPIHWPTQKVAPSQPIATQSVNQSVTHRRLLDRSLPPLAACVYVCVCMDGWMDVITAVRTLTSTHAVSTHTVSQSERRKTRGQGRHTPHTTKHISESTRPTREMK